jgi:hypothetical protein
VAEALIADGTPPVGHQLARWLAGELAIGGRSLETGCGGLTPLFAAVSADHTVVSPHVADHERAAARCAALGVPTDHVTFVAAPPHEWMPAAASNDALGPLDALLLASGDGYPVPALEWFYAGAALRRGSLLVIDRVDVRAGADLAGFLRADPARWRHQATIDAAALLRACSDDPPGAVARAEQPWNRVTPTLDQRLRHLLSRAAGR